MKVSDYSGIPILECADPMVDLAAFPFAQEPVQFRRGFTTNPQLWLRQTAAVKLEETQRAKLEPEGLCLKILDAWRPRDVQNKVYAVCWNELAARHPEWDRPAIDQTAARFVIDGNDPALIPPHATGGAVDLTLVRAGDGAELDMGSLPYSWDENGPIGGVQVDENENLRRLVIALQEAGFVQDPDQWWHFDYGNQKWAGLTGAAIAIYGEIDPSMGFMKKGAAYGHGAKLPFEVR